MKKLITFIVSGFLLVGAFGCEEAAKKAADTSITPNANVQKTDKDVKSAGKSTTIPVAGADNQVKTQTKKTSVTKADEKLETAVSNKLKTGLPGTQLEVENDNGEITIKGTATSKAELAKAEKLVKEVKGVKSVTIEAKVKATKNS